MNSTIPPKHPRDSRYEKIMPFSTDLTLREAYLNFFGYIRFGKLLEELDMAAGIIAYRHADGFALDLDIVTAACDRIDLLGPLPSDCDLRLQGQINWVGRSSMEVGIRMESKVDGRFQLVMRAYFIMVARKGPQPYEVNRLILETEEEQRRFEDAAQRQEQRRKNIQTNYLKTPPTAEEIALLHELFLKSKVKAIDGILMATTERQSSELMHPQNRNIHHKIFGGYLMRKSFEIAWNIAFMYCRRQLFFLSVDHMYFLKPVEIGSIVSFNGLVIYTGKTSYIVEVTAEVIHPMTGMTEVTNVSYFTFVALDEQRRPAEVPKVLPHTYEEGLKYLEGAKRYQYGKRLQAVRKQRQSPTLEETP